MSFILDVCVGVGGGGGGVAAALAPSHKGLARWSILGLCPGITK